MNQENVNNNIFIASLERTLSMIALGLNGYDIISIRSSNIDPIVYAAIDAYGMGTDDVLAMTFDDIVTLEKERILPSETHIRKILDWSKDKGQIIVHCTAGVCRSAACAYLIECLEKPPTKAIRILDYDLHSPNNLILKIGADILKRPEIVEVYEEFRKKQNLKYRII